VTAGQQLDGVLHLNERRQHQQRHLGEPRPDLPGCPEPLGGVRRRHADVDDRQVGCGLLDQRQQMLAVVGQPDHGEAVPVEQARQPFAQQDVVIGDHHPQGEGRSPLECHQANPVPVDTFGA
jgi:hypothetical protein